MLWIMISSESRAEVIFRVNVAPRSSEMLVGVWSVMFPSTELHAKGSRRWWWATTCQTDTYTAASDQSHEVVRELSGQSYTTNFYPKYNSGAQVLPICFLFRLSCHKCANVSTHRSFVQYLTCIRRTKYRRRNRRSRKCKDAAIL